MPKVPIDYSKTIIYKIEHTENENLVYVGFTTNWDRRKCQHKSNSNNNNSSKHNYKLYQMIRENGGFEMFRMIEVEKFPCNGKREAEKRETEVMKELKANMNTYQSYTDSVVYREENKEKIREQKRWSYELNKEKVKEQQKVYRNENKDLIQERRKEYDRKYTENNRDKIKDKQKRKYDKNKDIIREKNKIIYEANKDKIKERCKEYRNDNKDLIKERRKEYDRKYREKQKLKNTT